MLQFTHGYYEGGYPVLSLRRVALRYATSWFLVDLIAVLPWEHMDDDLTALPLMKTVRLLRLRRLMKNTKLLAGGNVLRVLIILFAWLLITHWLACAFFALGWNMCGDGPGQYEQTWVTEYFDGSRPYLPQLSDTCGQGTPEQLGSVHVRAMYWSLATMSSMGYGSAPVAITDTEFVFSIFCQVMGACLAAAIFSNIAKLIEKLDAAGSRYSAQLDMINEFGAFYKLPRQMRVRLNNYVSFQFNVNRGYSLHDVTASLPPTLQEEIFFHVHERLLREVPMFASTDDAFIKVLTRVLKPMVLLRGDCAFRSNEPGDSMYFIQNGCMQMTNEDRSLVYCTLMPGSYFGELAMLCSQRRTATAQAIIDCILFFMRAADFDEVIKDFPKYYDDILEKAMARLEMTLKSNASLEVRQAHENTKKALQRQRSAKLGVSRFANKGADGLKLPVVAGSGRSDASTTSESNWATVRSVVKGGSLSKLRELLGASVAPEPSATSPERSRRGSVLAVPRRISLTAKGLAQAVVGEGSSAGDAPRKKLSCCWHLATVGSLKKNSISQSIDGASGNALQSEAGGQQKPPSPSLGHLAEPQPSVATRAPPTPIQRAGTQPMTPNRLGGPTRKGSLPETSPMPRPILTKAHSSNDFGSAKVLALEAQREAAAIQDYRRGSRGNVAVEKWKAQAAADAETAMEHEDVLGTSYKSAARERCAQRFASCEVHYPTGRRATVASSQPTLPDSPFGKASSKEFLAPITGASGAGPTMLELHSTMHKVLRSVEGLGTELGELRGLVRGFAVQNPPSIRACTSAVQQQQSRRASSLQPETVVEERISALERMG